LGCLGELIKIDEHSWILIFSIGLIISESRRNIDEPTLEVVFVFDDKLVILVEGLECTLPVFKAHICLLMWVYLPKKFLHQGIRQVKSTQSIMFYNESLKLIKVDFMGTLACKLKTLLDT
jgi:hypothetical protein